MVNKFTELKSQKWYANINITKDTTINAMQFVILIIIIRMRKVYLLTDFNSPIPATVMLSCMEQSNDQQNS